LRGSGRHRIAPLAFIPRFCTVPFGTLPPGGAQRFLPIVTLGHELGFLIANRDLNAVGRERERR
jgi:hypothetical protein